MFRKIIYFLFFLAIAVAGGVAGGVYWLVVINPGEEIKQENITAILGKESPVYYSDGETRLGVFFDDAHRQYVAFSEIPTDFVNALVASEDNQFFEHYGFDPAGIARAVIKNYQAGRVVQGGSTLTQQTAKNLFKRSSRSYQAKLKELLYALRLEYHYPKEKIFEFYANQFYVSGNGHGLGVAARYYFDKAPGDLTLLESAFIAGSVKRPNYYNPFIKKTDDAALLARERANARARYVLRRMRDLDMITVEEEAELNNHEIEFNKGKMGFALDYVMEMVTKAVSEPEVVDALEEQGISNLSTSGARVITTVDAGLQRKTLYSLRRELSRLDVRLRGYSAQQVQEELQATDYRGDSQLIEGAFLFGTLVEAPSSEEGEGDSLRIGVDLGRSLGVGIIDGPGIERLGLAYARWQRNRWSESTDKDRRALTAQLRLGDRVWVSVRAIDDHSRILLDLEKFPTLQGGALILQDGTIKAMAGGTENRFFNRAIDARRTMGSAFKPFVYAAALQLGWSPTDLLSNGRDIFVFQGQPYFPRPDHVSKNDEVSLSWAGVHSENLASIWLLYHMADHLSLDRFYEVADHVGLAPRQLGGEVESYRSFRSRVRDRHGIVVNRDLLRQAAFERAVLSLEPDFMFEGLFSEYAALRTLHYGLGFAKFSEEIHERLLKDEFLDADSDDKLTTKELTELNFQKGILAVNYMDLMKLQEELIDLRRGVEDPMQLFYDPSDNYDPFEQKIMAQLYYDSLRERYTYVRLEEPDEHMWRVDFDALRLLVLQMNSQEQELFWSSVSVGSLLSSSALDMVHSQVELEYNRLQELPAYSMEVLSAISDFRVLVSLRYLIAFAREMGIESQLEPVLSFPLGSNVVTLMEMVRMYEGLVTGKVTLFGAEDSGSGDVLAVIDRIESDKGEILYRPQRRVRRPVAQETALEVGHLLENVVKFGTGRYANREVRLTELGDGLFRELNQAFPLLGKTGTANRYTNSTFLGYLPGLSIDGRSLVQADGYGVGVYVGYDDNSPMVRNNTRIAGSSGALPTWTAMVKGLLAEEDYGGRLDSVDLSFNGLIIDRPSLGQMNLAVSAEQGGRLIEPAYDVDQYRRHQSTVMAVGRLSGGGRFVPARQFRPFWHESRDLVEENIPVH